MSQKIIIPKGLINPEETTIIEIPEDAHNLETVVAKPLYGNENCASGGDLSYTDSRDDYHYEYLYPEQYTNHANEPRITYIEEEIQDEELNWYHHNTYKKPFTRKRSIRTAPSYTTPLYSYSNYIMRPLIEYEPRFDEKDMLSMMPHESINNGMDCRWPLSAKEVITVLDILEKVEFNRLCKNLNDYQVARRRLLFETSNMHTLDDISASLIGP